jgi:hypothetical protein
VCAPDESRADWCVVVDLELGSEANQIGRPAERDQHFAGGDRAAAKQFRRRAIRSGRTLSANRGDAERDQHRGRERGDDD